MNLHRLIFKWILTAGLILPGLITGAQAWEWDGSAEKLLFDRINAVRVNPAAELKAYGFDTRSFITSHPELEPLMAGGMDPLAADTRLFAAAAGHAQDMAENGYFTKISRHGYSIAERMAMADFHASMADEIIGMVLFQNYLPREKALDILWKRILENELDSGKQPDPVLLNPEFTQIGISVRSGAMTFNGMNFNFYVAVCDFGRDRVTPENRELFSMINQARFFEMPDADDTVPAPYRFDIRLMDAAGQLAREIISDITDHEQTILRYPLEERLYDAGYDSSLASEAVRAWITVDPKSPGEIRRHFIGQLVSHESALPEDRERILLSTVFTEAGSMIVSQKQWFGENEYHVHVLVLVTALPLEEKNTFVCTGLPAVDPDLDLSGVLLQITGPDTLLYLFTGRAGEFSVELAPGQYVLRAAKDPGSGLIIPELYISVTDRNVFAVPEYISPENILRPLLVLTKPDKIDMTEMILTHERR